MSEIITVGLDLVKTVFQVHGADGSGRAVLRKKLRRAQVLEFFSQLPSCVVAMEACGGAHFRGREISKLGHDVRHWRKVHIAVDTATGDVRGVAFPSSRQGGQPSATGGTAKRSPPSRADGACDTRL